MNQQAGIDLSTGHAVDSFFKRRRIKDPWADKCVVTFIDTLINYKEVSYAYPSRRARRELTGFGTPQCFLKAKARNLLTANRNTMADDIIIPEEEVKRQHSVFVEWANIHTADLKNWLDFCETTERMQFNKATDATELDKYAKAYWGLIKHDLLSAMTNHYGDGLVFAFQSFLRAVQYQQIFGSESDYYAHPLREAAYRPAASQGASSLSNQAIYRWSWGQYFLCYLKRDNRRPTALDMNWLLDRVRSVRDITHEMGAAWYQLPTEVTDEAIENIAAATSLPAALKDNWRKAAKILVSTVPAVGAYAEHLPIVGVVLQLASATITESWDGTVRNAQMIKAMRGHLEWQGLFDEC